MNFCVLSHQPNLKLPAEKVAANEQGFVQVWHSLLVKPGTKAD